MKNKFLSIIFLSMLLLVGFGGVFEVADAQVSSFPSGCSSTMWYSTVTGLPCNGTATATTTFMAGCSSIFGFSTVTGLPCNGGVTATFSLSGCTSIFGYSTVNGLPCNGTMTATLPVPGTTTFPPVVAPGLPSTGAGGDRGSNLALLIGSGLISLFGMAYMANRFRTVKHA